MQVWVIEDEPAAARKLKRLLLADGRIQGISAVLDSVESAVQWAANHPAPDLIFSDIELADGLSFEIFTQLHPCPPIVFVSAYNQYALEAFRAPGVDYLLKPVQAKDLTRALDKYLSLRQPMQTVDVGKLGAAFGQVKEQHQGKRFLVRLGDKLLSLEAENAAYFLVEDRVVFFMSAEGKRYPLDQSLEEIEHLLDPENFFRINRQFLVNRKAISGMSVVSKSRVKLQLNPDYPAETIVSKERSPTFRLWIRNSG